MHASQPSGICGHFHSRTAAKRTTGTFVPSATVTALENKATTHPSLLLTLQGAHLCSQKSKTPHVCIDWNGPCHMNLSFQPSIVSVQYILKDRNSNLFGEFTHGPMIHRPKSWYNRAHHMDGSSTPQWEPSDHGLDN